METEQTNIPAVENNEADYISAISELKANTVDKAQYDKLREENKKLISTLASGQAYDTTVLPKKRSADEIRKELFQSDKEIDNLSFISNALELRDTILEDGGNDVFAPYGAHISPTPSDYNEAQHVADVLKECVDYANGDSQLFTAELQRRMVDTAPISIRNKNNYRR